MLTAEAKREIEQVAAHAEQKRAAASDALMIVQKHHGWVSDEHLREAAGLLEMSPDELDSIATFYSLVYRRAVGRHVILLCDSVSCWVVGYEKIREHLKSHLGLGLGQTTDDGRFTLLPVACLGACDRAPVMMIDEELHGELTPEKVDEILLRYP
jgi:NADH-quinone oxidoreductase subunit E